MYLKNLRLLKPQRYTSEDWIRTCFFTSLVLLNKQRHLLYDSEDPGSAEII